MAVWKSVVCLAFLGAKVSAGNSDKSKVHAQGTGGKMTLFDKDVGRTADPNRVTMEFSSFEEKKADKSKINSKTKTSFADQEFDITESDDETFAGAKVSKVSMETDLAGWGKLKFETYTFNESATVSTDMENWQVNAGDTKWAIKLKNWTWCEGDACGQDEGEFVDIGMEIKNAAGTDATAKDNGKDFELGGMEMKLSNRILVDGEWQEMDTGFPKYQTKGGKKQFIFRFPKFQDNITYDPVMSPDEESDDGSQGGSTGGSTGTGGTNADSAYSAVASTVVIAAAMLQVC